MNWDQYINTIEDKSCVICNKIRWSPTLIIDTNGVANAMLDEHPVTRFHTLIVPHRHAEGYFDLTNKEKDGITRLIDVVAAKMIKKDKTITGFNIGWNYGESAGQTVSHAHCHVIPRRDGDIDDPTGGIRGAIPEKRIYR